MSTAKKSYVFRVSQGKTWRKIQISKESTLEDLHLAIQDVFEFDNDHLYSFFMDNKKWSKDEDMIFVSSYDDVDGNLASEAVLQDFTFARNQKFMYLFDFGDEWIFTVSLSNEVEDETPTPIEIAGNGALPQQYPDYEDEDFDYDEEDED